MTEFLYYWLGFVSVQLVIAGLLGWCAKLTDLLFDDEMEEDDNDEDDDEEEGDE